eukprot:TRINITY_DN2817_c0_g1_i1.p1 TRINITY_DN2817_c0_g1~~TRINITY_DN2817_c0_g1_i1.p1  ORF type:complete len:271 (+),score=94.35 TRINITY_DN2817_c0_g1_i1:40-813(+)
MKGGVFVAFVLCLIQLACANVQLRVIHAFPATPNIDFYANNYPTGIQDLAFTQLSDYVSLTAGIWELKVTLAGAKNTVYKAQNFELVSHVTYSLIVQADPATNQVAFNLKVDDNTPPRERYAKVRFLHLAPTNPPTPVTVEANGAPVFIGFNYGQASPYQFFPSGLYNISYKASNSDQLLTVTPDILFNSRTVYTIFALGTDSLLVSEAVDMVPSSVDACAGCPCPANAGTSSNSEMNLFFDGMVPAQTSCCSGQKL